MKPAQIAHIKTMIRSQPHLSNTEMAALAGIGVRAHHVAAIRKELTGNATVDRWRGGDRG